MLRKKLVVLGTAALCALAVYGTLIEPRWLQFRRSRIHIRRLPPAFEGLRIALLSDLHGGGLTPLSLIRRAAGMAMDGRPHLIALTGDFGPGLGAVLDQLDELYAPLGVYAVPGNHDYKVGIDQWHEQVGLHPVIEDLTNRAIVHEIGDARICIAGVDDYYMGAPRLMLPAAEARDITILLAHSPDQAERCRREYDAVDLIVSGHTHGGQIRFPGLRAPVSSSRHPELYEEGLRRRPWTQVYTSRGIGTHTLPVRFFARPEVAILELTGRSRPLQPRRWRRRGTAIAPLAARDAHAASRRRRRTGEPQE
ncbi:MAG: metallophosphoesterase [Longimicrobiales bacterium]